jgi:catechol 2,3-dioxygenase-like lactoylglutathione lyase family enzyme
VITRIDHIQLAAPKGSEPAAREFYGSILGLPEIEKPVSLRARGGCWFQCGDQQLHIGVEPDFHPAKRLTPPSPYLIWPGFAKRLRPTL